MFKIHKLIINRLKTSLKFNRKISLWNFMWDQLYGYSTKFVQNLFFATTSNLWHEVIVHTEFICKVF